MFVNVSYSKLSDYVDITFNFDKRLVDIIKNVIPSYGRQYNKATKTWTIHKLYYIEFEKSARLLGYTIYTSIDTKTVEEPVESEYTYNVLYVGIPKKRFGSYYSFGMIDDGSWLLQFSRNVLKEWFGDYKANDPYSILGIPFNKSLTQKDIKKAYHSVSKQWHPDVCKEDNAKEMFQEIQLAYSKIDSETKREEYDARREMALRFTKHGLVKAESDEIYIPRRRCGVVKFIGKMSMGRLIVSKIISWEDITDNSGKTLVTWWNTSLNSLGRKFI